MRQIYTTNPVWLLIAVLYCLPILSKGAYFSFLPTTVINPDGTKIECYASGDEFYNWLHDKDGYTIIQDNEDGFYYFASLSDGKLIPSKFRADHINPAAFGFVPWIKSRNNEKLLKSGKTEVNFREANRLEIEQKVGEVNNLVIYIRFADDKEFTDSRQTFETIFNQETGNSLKSYFKEVSYNKLLVNSTHYPVCQPNTNLSYKDSRPRNYYLPYNAITNRQGYSGFNERTEREQQLLADAVNNIRNQVPATLDIDLDNNNKVDNICFIVRGNCTGWSELLWSHHWILFSRSVYINDKIVSGYTFHPENQKGINILSHEVFHVFGAPDLYQNSENGISPVGAWDIMGLGSGHMGSYMKWKYSGHQWIENIPEIKYSGYYTINPITSPSNNCYKIKSPNSSSEFFLVEYRLKSGTFESNLPGSGLLVYRINTAYAENTSVPANEVYIYRPGGTLIAEGNSNLAYFSASESRSVINNFTDPSCILTDGSPGGISISNVGFPGSTISFFVNIDENQPNFKQTTLFKEQKNQALNDEIVIYPNPVKDILNLKLLKSGTNYSYAIFNTQGIQIEQNTITSISNPIHLNKLQAGLYFIVLKNGNKTIKKSFIKE